MKIIKIFDFFMNLIHNIAGGENMNVFKELRIKQKLTQVELAKLLNLNQTTVGKWENEKAFPDYQSLINLSKLYNVSTDYLLGNTNEATNTQNAIASPELAKDIWLKSLNELDYSLITTIFKLNELQKYKVQAYMFGMLEK